MTLALDVASRVVCIVLALPTVVRICGYAVEKWRRPVQMFHGRIFPHPDDDGWSSGGCRYLQCGPVVIDWDYIGGHSSKLLVGGVVVAKGARVRRYGREVERIVLRRDVVKALEALP